MRRFGTCGGWAATVIPASLLLSLGCVDGGAGRPELVRIDTLANGAIQVTSLEDGRWAAGDGTPWTLVEELRIGSLDGEHDAFARIVAVETLPDGRIYVLDGGARVVRSFDDAGAHLATFGGQGDGPGELRAPVSMSVGPDGNLWIADVSADRFTVFSPEGELVATHRYAADEIVGRGGFAADGRFHDLSFRRLLVLDRELRPESTISMPPFEGEFYSPPPQASSPGSFSTGARRPVPFTARQAYALHPDGSLWVALTDRYALTRLGTAGDTVTVVRREGVTAVPVGSEDRAEAEEVLLPWIQRGADVDLSRIPEIKPLFSRFLFAADGHLWVELETETGYEGRRWDVFDPDGAYLGPVETNLDFGALVVRDGVALGVVRDEFDVQYVVRARIRADEGGG